MDGSRWMTMIWAVALLGQQGGTFVSLLRIISGRYLGCPFKISLLAAIRVGTREILWESGWTIIQA